MNSILKQYDGDWHSIFSKFSDIQVPNGYAIADMALENYVEMRDSVNDSKYKIRREIESELGLSTFAVNWPIGSGEFFSKV